MGIITGIAATIIAGVKGRTTYAWVMGIWTVLGLITSLVAGFGIAPGIIFLIIAIGLKKAGTETNENQSAQNAIPKEQLEEAKKFICDSCGFLSKGWYQECPECGAKGKMRKGSDAEIIEWNHIVLPGDQAPDTQAEEKTIMLVDTDNTLFCQKCGHKLEEGSQLCSECGEKVNS